MQSFRSTSPPDFEQEPLTVEDQKRLRVGYRVECVCAYPVQQLSTPKRADIPSTVELWNS